MTTHFVSGDNQLPTIYQLILQARFSLLPPVQQRFLGDERGGVATGRVTVSRAASWLRNLAATSLGIPPAGSYELMLQVTPHAGGQRWVRRFGDQVLETLQTERRGLLMEASGPAGIGFELIVEEGALLYRPRRAWIFGIPIPLWLAPGIEAKNRPGESDSWHVSVRFSAPLLGYVGDYEGDVTYRQ